MPETPIYVTRADGAGRSGAFAINAYVALALMLSATLAATLWSLTAVVYWFVFMYGVIT